MMEGIVSIKFWLQRMKEPSTWNAISVLLGTIGYNIPDDWGKALMGLASTMLVFINLIWKKDTQSK
jgi:hypothetical protein